jgi:hypothetical protein
MDPKAMPNPIQRELNTLLARYPHAQTMGSRATWNGHDFCIMTGGGPVGVVVMYRHAGKIWVLDSMADALAKMEDPDAQSRVSTGSRNKYSSAPPKRSTRGIPLSAGGT